MKGTAVPFHHFSVEYIYKAAFLSLIKLAQMSAFFRPLCSLRRDCERLVAIAYETESDESSSE